MADIERVRYGLGAKDGALGSTPKEAKSWTVTRCYKISGHWGAYTAIGELMTYDEAVQAYRDLVAENFDKEHPSGTLGP